MRPLRNLIFYILSVFVGAAIIAPWIYKFIHFCAQHFSIFQALARQDFHRYLNRCMLIIALIGLVPLFRSFGFKKLTDLGIAPLKDNLKRIGLGFLFGFITLAIAVILALTFNVRHFDSERTTSQIFRHLFNASLSAIVVGVLEEILFRGGIFGALKRFYHWQTALLISSGVYALCHFFTQMGNFTEVHWYSGFIGLALMFRGFTDLTALIPGFINLFLAGWILGELYRRSGNLYLSIGTHAGWIFWVKSYGFFTRESAEAGKWLLGSNKLIDGWAAMIVLVVFLIAIIKLYNTTDDRNKTADDHKNDLKGV